MIDVLIIGAGPTGLTMALECVRYGITCRIIDRAAAPTAQSKAIAIQARTLETFQRMGVHHRFLQEGLPIGSATIYSNHKKQAHIDLSNIPSPFPYALSLEQSKTEQILIDSLNLEVERGVELLGFEEKNGSIIATTNQGEIRAHYLIGCDGAHSVVRKQLGCTFQGKVFRDIFSLADVHLDWDRPHNEITVFLESQGIMAVFPLPEKNRVRLIFQLKRLRGAIGNPETPVPTIQEIDSFLAQCTSHFVLKDPRWITNFHINSRLSNMYRKGNVFLAGDAAHIHSPVGGQGMNAGIQDAFNLAWKIAYVHLHKVDKKLLDTYEKERRALGKKLLKGTEEASKLVSIHNPFLIRLRNFFLSKMLSIQWMQKKLITALSELDIGYPEKRVPNYKVIHEGKEIDYFTYAEKSTNYHLLYSGKPPKKKQFIEQIQVKEKIENPLLVRPDGYR